MPSFKTSVAVVATALFTLGAQSQSTYSIDPSTVPIATRDGWCTTQKQSCPLLCTQVSGGSRTTASNDCDAETLTYSCVCGNGISPNASEFSQTLPYFICTEYDNQCVAGCSGNTACQSACRSDHPCGAQDPVRVNTSTISTMTSTAGAGATGASNTQIYTGIGGAATTASTSGKKSGAQSALDMGRSYGLAVVFAGIFAGFALVM